MRVDFWPNAKVLIVDDERANILMLETVLDMAGYTNVSSLTDSRETLDFVTTWDPDILLLDMSMPFMNGIEVLQALETNMPGLYMPILILTADASSTTKHQALTHGATDFLTKPFDIEEVLLRIRNLLEISFHGRVLESKVLERTKELESSNANLKAAQEEVVVASKIKREFIANMSHELRTPMNGILGLTSMLREMLSDPNDRQILDLIALSSERLHEVLEDILTISILQNENPTLVAEKTDLARLVQGTVDLYKAEAFKKGISMSCVSDNSSSSFESCDSIKLKQLLGHLIGNAVKFTNRGTVTVSWRCTTEPNGTCFIFSVADTGVGIPQDALAKIFEPFVQLDGSSTREYSGVGLGLAITRRILDLMGGEISVSSQVGVGTTVTVSIPLSGRKEVEVADGNSGETEPSRVVILLAEDNPIQSASMREKLEFLGCAVTEAANGQRALELVSQHSFDAVLMDVHMPICDGIEATRLIRARESALGLPRLPICSLGAYISSNHHGETVINEFDLSLDKPVSQQSLENFLVSLGQAKTN